MHAHRFRLRFRWEALLWVALATFVGYRIWPQVAAAFGVASANAPAPAFRLTTLDGHVVTNDQFRGKVVLVNFWATWCPPCRLEMPGFQSVYDHNRNHDFVVLGVSMDAGDVDAVQRFLADHHISYPVAMASDRVIRSFGGVNLLPTSFLIDRQGLIRNEVRGVFAPVALEQAVKHLLHEPAAAIARAGGPR